MRGSIEELLLIAEESLDNCYCPYSNFRVAAVIEDDAGEFHSGVNIENASYGLTVCAERSALFKAVSGGATGFRRMLVFSPDGEAYPCGACREVLAEFCSSDFPIFVAHKGEILRTTLGELLPHRFSGLQRQK